MAEPAQRPEPDLHDVLGAIQSFQANMDKRLSVIEATMATKDEVAELRGRFDELSKRSPTLLQIVGAMLAINAGMIALATFAFRLFAP